MGGKSGASEQNDGKWPQSGEQQPVSHRADASVRVGQAEEVETEEFEDAYPTGKVLVQTSAVHGAERRSDLVKADHNLQLGFKPNARLKLAEPGRHRRAKDAAKRLDGDAAECSVGEECRPCESDERCC